MSSSQISYLKNNWITFANLVLLLTLVYNFASIQQEFRDDIRHLKEHVTDEARHMPFSRKIEIFVPRTEIDSRLKNIESKQDAIYELLLKNNK